jgi:hypothetical protein
MLDQNSNNIDLNDDLPTIVEKKIKFHEAQLAFHQAKLDEMLKYRIPANGSYVSSGETKDKARVKQSFDKSWWWEKQIPELVNSIFANKEFKNSDLMAAGNVPGLQDENFKKEVRYAISVALKAWVTKGFLAYRKEDGVKGYFYRKK